jgi:uncharacterized Zn finger protein
MIAEWTAKAANKSVLKRGRPPGIRTCPEFDDPCWWTAGLINRVGEIASVRQINAAKKYAKAGKVVELNVSPGMIEAKVQGRRKIPYCVRLYSPRPNDRQLDEIKRRLCEKAIYRSLLLSGEMPRELDAIFKSSGVALSLEGFSRSQFLCGCSEPENICKHILATVYVAAVAFDRDPFLLLKMRGFEKNRLLAVLSAPVGADDESDAGLPLHLSPDEAAQYAGQTGDIAPIDDLAAIDASFYGSEDLSVELNRMSVSRREAGDPAPVFDFPLWRGEISFAESIAPYYKSVEKFFSDL